jgi:hypothetical protein
MHGAPLIERVIEQVGRHGWATTDAPDITEPVPVPPEVIAGLRLPGGRPLPPSLRRWLAFDGSWLAAIGWYDDPRHPVFEGRTLGEAAAYAYGESGPLVEMFTAFEALLPQRCFPLVGGSDSRRLLYAGEPDASGEYPVLVTDIDDMPYVAVMYPGLDVYLAELAGVIELDLAEYTGLIDHEEYGARTREHAARTGLGADGREIDDLDPEETGDRAATD